MTQDLLTDIAIQLPLVAAFAWFIIIFMRSEREQRRKDDEARVLREQQRDGVWQGVLEGNRKECSGVFNRVMSTVEARDVMWRDFVNERDKRYESVLSEIQNSMSDLSEGIRSMSSGGGD